MACNFVVVRLVTGATNASAVASSRRVRRLIIVTRESVNGDLGPPLPIGRMEAFASFECNESAYWQQGVQQKDRRGAFSFGFCRARQIAACSARRRHHACGAATDGSRAKKTNFQRAALIGDEHKQRQKLLQ